MSIRVAAPWGYPLHVSEAPRGRVSHGQSHPPIITQPRPPQNPRREAHLYLK